MWNYFEFRPVVQEEMPFKGISYLELGQPFCSAERMHLSNFGKGIKRNNSVKIFCSVEWIHLSNFERGHHGEHSC